VLTQQLSDLLQGQRKCKIATITQQDKGESRTKQESLIIDLIKSTGKIKEREKNAVIPQ